MNILNNRREALDHIRQTISLINSTYKMGDDHLLDNLKEVEQWLDEEITKLQSELKET